MRPIFADSRACAALLALLSPLAQAAEPAPLIITGATSKALQLTPSVIEAEAVEKAPLGATQVTAQQLQSLRSATSDSATLLRGVPGVSLNSAGGISSLPAIRGLADDRLRIKIDGMDLVASCPNHMNPALSYIAPSNLGKLQVFAGITPVSVGGDSIGGTIVADNAAPEFAAPGAASINKGEVGAFYRSNNDARGGNFSATHSEQAFNIRYDGSYSKANNYSAGGDFKSSTSTGQLGNGSPLDEVASSAYETENHALGMALKLGEDLLELKLGYQHVPQELFANQRMDMTDNTQQRMSLRYLSQFNWGELDTRVYHEKVEHEMNFGPDKQFWYGTAPGMPMESHGKTSGASVKANIDLSERDLLRVGGEYQRYRLDDYWPASGTGGMSPNTFENITDGQRDRSALFGEWERQINPAWISLVGLRYEHVASDAGEVHGYGDTNGMAPMFNYQKRDSEAFNA
ncbi:MAG: TonB-dependent receptor, partial [Pseudomonas sp.]|nr:TonB-dependent receptor [Pseudomonas sp.]